MFITGDRRFCPLTAGQKFYNLAFLRPLVASMTEKDPRSRPDAAQALEKWQKISRRIFLLNKAWRLRSREESLIREFLRDIRYTSNIVPWLFGRVESRALSLLRRPKQDSPE